MEFRLEDEQITLVNDEGNEVGEITWALAGTVMIVDHTFVDPEYRQDNFAKELVRQLVEYARKEEYEVLPLCPYARTQFEKNAEYQDVLRK
ncbi:GNAT family N-acetyltransferase [Pilibacter termitis]|uniref:GNAT family N-acetyltransferase n=1 Tax=Pilibacter termitis TaxID=263852 RepID=UPI00099A61B8|nr:GNAT family N-acetyltransferase [Pilibacter termitis]